MNKYIAYEKLSKKEKRKIDSCQRRTWGYLNPITRKPQNSRAYNRKKNQCWKDELRSADSFLWFILFILFCGIAINIKGPTFYTHKKWDQKDGLTKIIQNGCKRFDVVQIVFKQFIPCV